MIKRPSEIKFFVPTAIEQFSRTAEPTLVGIGGEEYIGDVIAAGGQAINAMDGRPNHPVQADTDGVATTWRIDCAMSNRIKADFCLIDQHNLRDAYPAAVRNQVGIFHHSADVFGSATEIAAARVVAGLLGQQRPCLDFDGVDDYVSIADNAELDPGYGDYTIWGRVWIPDNTVTTYLYSRYQDANNYAYIRYYVSGSTHRLDAVFVVSGSTLQEIQATWTPTAGTWYDIAWMIDNGDDNKLYVDGTELTSVIGTIDDGGDLSLTAACHLSRHNTTYSRSRQSEWMMFNLALSAAEIADLPETVPDEYVGASQTEMLTDGGLESWTGNLLDSWVEDGGIFDETGIVYAGSHSMKRTGGGGAYQSRTTIAGKRYRSRAFVYNPIGGSTSAGVWICNLTYGGTTIATAYHTLADGGWAKVVAEFAALSATTVFALRNNTAAKIAYLDAASLVRIGLVAHYPTDGLNKQDGKWYDAGGNGNDGTVTGAEFKDIPYDEDRGFILKTFDEVDDRYWFIEFNDDGKTGSSGVDTLIGQVVLGKMYSFNGLKPNGFGGSMAYPGIAVDQSEAGPVMTEEKYGVKHTWDLPFQLSTDAQFEALQEMLTCLKGRLYPFYICFNWDDPQPIIWRVRAAGDLDWDYQHGLNQPWTPTLPIEMDL